MKLSHRSLLTCACALALLANFAQAAGRAKHVVIIVMDGLRADSVVDADMPTLSKLAAGGTFFANHHPVYLSTTEVNGTALATGVRPGRNGIVGNREYRPDMELLQPIDTQGEWAIWKGDQLSGGKWIRVETLPQIVRAAGAKTVVAGTKGVAIMWDRKTENRAADQPTLFAGETIPSSVKDALTKAQGPIPLGKNTMYFPNAPQDAWTTRALTERFWAAGENGAPADIPALSVLWLSEPDYSQHGSGPGSKVAREALHSSDDCLAKVLAKLDALKLRDQTDVMIVSDHGFSTVGGNVDIFSDLLRADIDVDNAFLEKPVKGNVLVNGLGGSVAFYVIEHDAPTIDKLVKHLQETQYAGVIFTRDGVEGTFKFTDAGIDSPDAADVVISMRWAAQTAPRAGSMPGLLLIDGNGYKPGQGMHGSLSRFDMHNTLVAAGPDFKTGFKSQTPSGNIDVAPTVLSILGIKEPAEGMDGRVLAEAFVDAKDAPEVKAEVMTAKRKTAGPDWRQYLKVSRVGKQSYYDEGNAGDAPK